MAIARSCNRCGAPVEKALDPAPRAVVVPAASPSTWPVTTDLDCQIGLVTGENIDYCPPCLLSILLARALPNADLALPQRAIAAIAAARTAVAGVADVVDATAPKEPA